MAIYLRYPLGRTRRFQLRARLGSPSHFSIPCHLKPYVRFSLIRLSCSLRNKAYTPIGLELLSGRDTLSGSPGIDPISRISPPYSTASNQIDLRFAVYLSPQFLQIYGSFYHSPLPLLHRKIQGTAEPLRSGKVMLSLPSSLLQTHPPPSRLSVHFVFQLIGPTFLLPFPSGTRRASPVDSASLYPCRRCYPATAL